MLLPFLMTGLMVWGIMATCPLESVPRQTDVDVKRNTGIWYEIGWFPVGNVTGSKNYGHNYYLKGQELYFHNFMSRSGDNECFQLPEKHLRRIAPAWFRNGNGSDFIWVETDYNHYFVEFTCSSRANGNCNEPSVLLFSRKQTLEEKYTNRTAELLPHLCVAENRYVHVVHDKDCATYTAVRDCATYTAVRDCATNTAVRGKPPLILVLGAFLGLLQAFLF